MKILYSGQKISIINFLLTCKDTTMPKKKPDDRPTENPAIPQKITDTLEPNYIPYAMSVIVSRAIPEIDGFKPC